MNIRISLLFVWIFLLPHLGKGQSFSKEERLQGFSHRQDTTFFIFDEALYPKGEGKIVLTGSFRQWSQDMADPTWTLSKKNPHILAVYNPEFDKIPPQSEFKFRRGKGEWLSPPAGAPNEKGTNLVFMKDITPPMLTAEINPSGTIWAYTHGQPASLDVDSWKLTNGTGEEISIARVMPNLDDRVLIVSAQPLDIRRVYFLEIPERKLRTVVSFDAWFSQLYTHKPLGANIGEDREHTAFRIFAPRAERIRLYLYDGPEDEFNTQFFDMEQDSTGTWEVIVPQNLEGKYYDFTVHGAKDPGNHFYETVPVHISDPYSRANVECWGRSRVCKKTVPAPPLKDGIPPLEDVIAYEVHVQDFTRQLPVPEGEKGTFKAMMTPGLTNSKGEPIGFDYLVNLGINVVHLMPVQEFLHYHDDDWKESFENDPFMKKHGINTENYQWGYRTSHALAVENRFRVKGTEYGSEREQFRDLVTAFHEKGIAVIIDIVPNHSAENMDGKENPYFFHWNVLDKQYYYRTKDLDHIGEYGNEVKTENRPMVQRWLIDQCKDYIDEFGIDGFRVDLAGQIDRQTLLGLREAVGPDIIIYGEPWIASNDPAYESNPSWDWYKHNSPICFFQDDFRNAVQGPPGNPQTKGKDRGYAGANFHQKEKVKMALSNRFPDDKTPVSGISYIDIHDNWTLADRFAKEDWNAWEGVEEERYKLAALMLYTGLGPIVAHGGVEIMRSKGQAELKETVKTTNAGLKVYLHGKRDTYNMAKPNEFHWEHVGATAEDEVGYGDHKSMYAFFQGLNHFRLSEQGKVFRRSTPAPDGFYRWVDTVNPYQLGYIVDGKVFVLINTGSEPHDWDNVYLPEGTWKLIGNNDAVDHVNGVTDEEVPEKLAGDQAYQFSIQGPGFKMWVKE
ncbi:MAG: alpha-amylase family glycosyl hydrolase [Bacteroidota bacterium]